jgi:folate-binding protein YgfZ
VTATGIAAPPATWVVARPDRVVAHLEGPRAAETLNGLVTNDVAALAVGQGCYAAALTPKGKVLSDLRAVIDPAGVTLLLPTRGAEAFATMIGKYVNPRLARWHAPAADRVLTVHGPDAAALVAAVTGLDAGALAALPPHAAAFAGEGMAVRSPVGVAPAFDVMVRAAADDALARALAAGAAPGEPDRFTTTRLEAGWPEFGVDFDDTCLTQEARLDALGAVSYTKGCYTGQEVVARLHFRGHVNRRLVRLTADVAVRPGAAVTRDDGSEVGRVTSAAVSPRQGPLAIAMLRREVAAGARVLVASATAPAEAVVHELPAATP